MKFLLYTLFIFGFLSANAQFVYLSAPEGFVISNASDSNQHKATWLFFEEGTSTAEIHIASGKKLKRNFKMELLKPYYVIENEKVRYRPNLLPIKADTLYILSASAVTSTIAEEAVIEPYDSVLAQIKTLPYEWEKTERIKVVLAQQKLSCAQQADLLRCLQYDASRIDIINTTVIQPECLPMLQNMLAPAFRNMIIKR